MNHSEDLVRLLYRELLGRDVDPEGLAAWSAVVDDGIDARELVARLLDNDEARRAGWTRELFPTGGPQPWSASPFDGDTPPIVVTDVGAAPLDYEADIHAALLDRRDTTLVCFEPAATRAAALRARHGHAVVIESCAGDGTSQTFYETIVGVTSSLYEPNTAVGEDLLEAGDEMRVVATEAVDTVRLDDVDAAAATTFLKLDVQAAERDVLRNATRALDSAVAVHTEFETYPLYIDQPMGNEVWNELDAAGFDLYWFHHLQAYRLQVEGGPMAPPRRLGWGDGVFFPKRDRVLRLDDGAALQLCAVWHDVYRAVDHVAWLLERHPSFAGGPAAVEYREFLSP